MDDMIRVKSGDFHANILLEGLPTLTLPQLRRLFRILFKARWENEDTVAFLGERLAEQVVNAKEEWRVASQNYVDGWKNTAKLICDKKAIAAQARINTQLIKAVKATKAQYDRWGKIKAIFDTLYKEN